MGQQLGILVNDVSWLFYHHSIQDNGRQLHSQEDRHIHHPSSTLSFFIKSTLSFSSSFLLFKESCFSDVRERSGKIRRLERDGERLEEEMSVLKNPYFILPFPNFNFFSFFFLRKSSSY